MRTREDKTEFKGRTWDLLLQMEVILQSAAQRGLENTENASL